MHNAARAPRLPNHYIKETGKKQVFRGGKGVNNAHFFVERRVGKGWRCGKFSTPAAAASAKEGEGKGRAAGKKENDTQMHGTFPQRCTKRTARRKHGRAVRKIFRKPPFAAGKAVAFGAAVWYNGGMDGKDALLYEGATGEKFAAFYEMLAEANQKFNLTAITGREDCYAKHFADSLAGSPFFPQGARVCEVGSGGGFPSVPLMIARPDLRFVLLEPTQKKCGFLREVCAALRLPAEVYALRAEDAARDARFRERFDVCCARAVARMNTLAEYCLPLVRTGGLFIAYKGRAEEELQEAAHAFAVLGARVRECARFNLEGAGERTVVVAEKTAPTPAAYPRGRGRERSRPL